VARRRSGVAVGFTYFAAIMMMLSGGFEILQGLSAIIKKHFYVVGQTMFTRSTSRPGDGSI
jgi:TRAP-type mannitol/chloroaromatic compound transport system permease small subunit